MHEVKISQDLDHKNLVKFVKWFSIEKRHVIIIPFFPRSVADMMNRKSLVRQAAPLAAIQVIARYCFDALRHLHSKKLCYADLKHANIMLQNVEDGHATLVDYGATVPIGSPIREFTDAFCMDVDTAVGSENWTGFVLGPH